MAMIRRRRCTEYLYPRDHLTNGYEYDTQIILKVNSEPVVGSPGFQTKSIGSNEYSGKAGYSDNPFMFTVARGFHKRMTVLIVLTHY